jgi:hypothetical protein
MKTLTFLSHEHAGWLLAAAVVLTAGPALAEPKAPGEPKVVIAADAAENSDEDQPSGDTKQKHKTIRIESIERDDEKKPAKEVAWLGISTEEVSEALSSQLGLKEGQGLVVTYVAKDSPAAKAGIQKNDVLVDLEGQWLLSPGQLRKLVRMQKEGDSVNLNLFRGGKKQSVSPVLGKKTEHFGLIPPIPPIPPIALDMGGLDQELSQLKNLHGDHSPVDEKQIRIEIRRATEQARRAVEQALRQSSGASWSFSTGDKDLMALARGGLDIDKGAAITVRKAGNKVKTVVTSDDTGSYVIVADPKKRLIAHDKQGKLLFDGEIETPEQQKKVPSAVWEKVKPMLEKVAPTQEDEEDDEPRAQAPPTVDAKS